VEQLLLVKHCDGKTGSVAAVVSGPGEGRRHYLPEAQGFGSGFERDCQRQQLCKVAKHGVAVLSSES